MKKNRAIVNVVSEDERYIKAQRRLIQSFHEFGGSYSECDFLRFAGERIVGSPKHHENPYAFKCLYLLRTSESFYLRDFRNFSKSMMHAAVSKSAKVGRGSRY